MRTLLLMLCLGFSGFLASGQGGRAAITGTLIDPAGVPVAAARLDAKNIEIGATFYGLSAKDGSYAIPDLPEGMYTLSVAVPGFKKYTHTGVDLKAAQILRENITLQIGNGTQWDMPGGGVCCFEPRDSVITGTLTDPVGAAVPAVRVEAKHNATGVVFSGMSTKDGYYSIPDLPAGRYTLSVRVSGFKKYVHTGVKLRVAQVLKENITLQLRGPEVRSVSPPVK